MAISDDILKRQRRLVREARGEKPEPEPPRVIERRERVRVSEQPDRKRVTDNRRAVHMLAGEGQRFLRYAKTACGIIVGPRRYGTMKWDEVTCTACTEKRSA